MAKPIVVICGILVAIVVIVGLMFPDLLFPRASVTIETETREEKYAEVRDAYAASDAPMTPALLEAETLGFLTRLGEAVHQHTTIASLFDVELMLTAAERQSRNPVPMKIRRDVLHGIRSLSSFRSCISIFFSAPIRFIRRTHPTSQAGSNSYSSQGIERSFL